MDQSVTRAWKRLRAANSGYMRGLARRSRRARFPRSGRGGRLPRSLAEASTATSRVSRFSVGGRAVSPHELARRHLRERPTAEPTA
eukprot:4776099-Pyramimonas_sp.AAC.1